MEIAPIGMVYELLCEIVIIYGLLIELIPELIVCQLIMNSIKFGNLLVTISRLSVLDRACEAESLQSESCCENKFQETHEKDRSCSGHP